MSKIGDTTERVNAAIDQLEKVMKWLPVFAGLTVGLLIYLSFVKK